MTKNTLFKILSISLLTTFSSCNFNSVIFGPWKNAPSSRNFSWKQGNDTIHLSFNGSNYQPTYIRNQKDTIKFDFSIESVVFKSANGNLLNGWFLIPKNKQNNITILHLHGNAGNLSSQLNTISPLVKQGFQVFMFDYSGYGYSEGSPSKENILVDANSAFDYLKNREKLKKDKFVIYGQSLGGCIGVVLGEQRQKEIDGLIIEGAFTSYKGMASNYLPVIGSSLIAQDYSAISSIEKFHKPILIIHSKEDQVIPFKMGKELYEKANNPKEFFEINGFHICGAINYPNEIALKIRHLVNDTAL